MLIGCSLFFAVYCRTISMHVLIRLHCPGLNSEVNKLKIAYMLDVEDLKLSVVIVLLVNSIFACKRSFLCFQM